MSGDVVMPHTTAYNNAMSQIGTDFSDAATHLAYTGAGAAIGKIAGPAIAFSIFSAIGQPALGAIAATPAKWIGGTIGWAVGEIAYEASKTDWGRGVVTSQLDNNTGGNLLDYNSVTRSVSYNVFHYTVGDVKVDAFMQKSGAMVCQQLNLLGTAASEIFGACDVKNTIEGADGDDKIYGGGGNDTLRGGAGKDLIQAGDGVDLMHGSEGADRFDFAGDGKDKVDDFRVGQDLGTTGFGAVTSFRVIPDAFGKTQTIILYSAQGEIDLDGAPWHTGTPSLATVQHDAHVWGIY
jgi:Ca2+-binding RTX toxin-like protein